MTRPLAYSHRGSETDNGDSTRNSAWCGVIRFWVERMLLYILELSLSFLSFSPTFTLNFLYLSPYRLSTYRQLTVSYRLTVNYRQLLGCLSQSTIFRPSLHPHTSVIDNRSSTLPLLPLHPISSPHRSLSHPHLHHISSDQEAQTHS